MRPILFQSFHQEHGMGGGVSFRRRIEGIGLNIERCIRWAPCCTSRWNNAERMGGGAVSEKVLMRAGIFRSALGV